MKWREINAENGRICFEEYASSKRIDCPSDYLELRKDLCELFSRCLGELGLTPEMISQSNNAYKIDCLFGLKTYELLNQKYGMSSRIASIPAVWRFLSVCVVPDVVEMRYGITHVDRFWKKDKRIWLRVLWWYVYLSWQGDADATMLVMKDNSTD